jgi:hypothetical protein
MQRRILAIGFMTAVYTATLAAQTGSTTAIPNAKGVYFRGASGFVGLPMNLLMPFEQGNVRWLLALGHSDAKIEFAGPHAAIQTGSAKPTLYVRGFAPSAGIYLVRQREKQDYREIRMAVSGDFSEWAHFRQKDLLDIDIKPVIDDVLQITPRADLKPGEYAIVSVMEQMYRNIRVGYDFGVSPVR